MADVYSEALERLQDRAAKEPAVLAFYSGGKDSLATLDLCCRAFRQVVAVHMVFVPGLAVMEERLELARKRWGVQVLYVPHWMVGRLRKDGIYCFPEPDVPEVTLQEVYALARQESGVRLIAHGGKAADGMWRRRTMKACADPDVAYPIAEWNKWEVLAYLAFRGIQAPDKFDLGLDTKTLLWLAKEQPEDFKRVCEWYPHAEAVLWRQKWYGTPEG